MFETGGRAYGNDAAAELDADGYIVVANESTFAEADRQLGSSSARVLKGSSMAGRRTLDLPEPESPRDTILAM